MSDWGWVGLAYAIVYLTLATYTISLIQRQRRAERSNGSR